MPALNQAYEIVSVNSAKALDVSGGSTTDGAPVIQYTYHDGTNQQWYFKLAGTINNQEAYEIVNINSSKALDVTGGSQDNGATIQQSDVSGSKNQLWLLNLVELVQWQECYQIVNANSGKVLNVTGDSVEDGAAIQQWDATGGANQQWLLYPVANLDKNPQIAVETKYMQNYRASSAVNGSNEMATICDTHGQTSLFTVGSDGNVYVSTPDPSSNTGYSVSQITTNMKVTSLSAGLDSQGEVVVFAATEPGPALYSIVRTISSTSLTPTWSAAKHLSLEIPQGAGAIARVMAQNIGGNLYLAVIYELSNTQPAQYTLSYTIWQGDASQWVFPEGFSSFSTLQCLWLGNTVDTVVFANFLLGKMYLYSIPQKQATFATTSPELDVVSVDSVVDSSGQNQTFAILADNNAYQLSGPSGGTALNPAYAWNQCSQSIAFQQIATEVNAQNQLQIFAVSAPMAVSDASGLFNVLYHWNDTDVPTPMAIDKSVGMYLGAVRNEQGDLDLFSVDSQDHLTHIFQEQQSENWTLEPVEIPTGPVVSFCSYSTDVTVCDNNGAAVINSQVMIWASEEARITVNGATFFVDPYHSAQTTTNTAGVLSITQEATKLAVPSLQINLSEFMTPEESIVIQQYAGVQSRLATVTGTDLMNATVADGSYLLADEYRTQENTDSMALSFNECMTMLGTPALYASTHRPLHKRGPKPGAWSRSSGSAADLRKLPASGYKNHWRLSIDSNTMRYQKLTREEAQALIASEKAKAASQVGSPLAFWDDIADFFEGVANEVYDVTQVVISAVENGVEAVISFMVGDVPYVFDVIVTVIEQAFDLVQVIFSAFAVIYEYIFQWLADLVNWDCILRCKDALVYTANQLLGFAQEGAPALQTQLDDNFAALQAQITNLFNEASAFVGASSIGGYAVSNNPVNQALAAAVSNNFLLNYLWQYINDAVVTTPSGTEDPITQLVNLVSSFMTTLEGTQAFTDAINFCMQLASSPDQMFTILLSTMWRMGEELLQAGIEGMKEILDAALEIAATIVASLQDLLNAPWDIPVLSDLYSLITNGSELTTLDLMAWIAALSINEYCNTPFPNDQSLADFESAFNTQMMLQAAGLAPSLTASSEPAFPLSSVYLDFLAAGFAGCTLLSGSFGAMLDIIPPPLELTPPQKCLSYANYALIFAALGCRFEWFFTRSDENLIGSLTATQWSYVAQIIGMLLLAAVTIYEYAPTLPPTQSSDVKVGGFVIGSLFQLAMVSIAAVQDNELAEKLTWRYILAAPWLAKVLRASPVIPLTGGESLPTLAALDVLFNTASANLGYIVLTEE